MAEATRRGWIDDGFLLCGIRQTESNVDDRFDDLLIALSHDFGAWVMKGTTKPGHKGTVNPTTYKGVTGAAWVIPGFYKDVYQLGIHAASNPNFAHEAWRQVGAFTFARDCNKDGDIDVFEPTQEGDDTYINFHRASRMRDEEYVGAYGIACQVAQNANDFEFAVKMYKSTKKYKVNPKALVSYLLLTMGEADALGITYAN